MKDEGNYGGAEASDTLGQDDIDSLLQSAAAGLDSFEGEVAVKEQSAIIGSDGRRISSQECPFVEPYDFSNPAFLGETEMRRLRLLHEDFIRYLEARFTLLLRCDFSLNMTQLSTKSYSQAVQDVDSPTHLALFRANPMPGIGFIEISPNLALTIASSIIGGKGHAPRLERYLTQIEIDLIEEFFIVLLDEWCAQWKLEEVLEPHIIGHEIVASVIQICEHDTVMFSLTMEATVRGAVGRITICVPLFMIENAIRQMQVKPDHEAQQRAKAMPSWRDGYELIPVVGLAEINIGSMSVSEVMNWQVGSVVSLPDGIMEAVTLRLAELPFFSCEAGIENEHRAVKIREKIQKKENIWEMMN